MVKYSKTAMAKKQKKLFSLKKWGTRIPRASDTPGLAAVAATAGQPAVPAVAAGNQGFLTRISPFAMYLDRFYRYIFTQGVV